MASELLNEEATITYLLLFPEILPKAGKNLIKNHAIITQMMSEL